MWDNSVKLLSGPSWDDGLPNPTFPPHPNNKLLAETTAAACRNQASSFRPVTHQLNSFFWRFQDPCAPQRVPLKPEIASCVTVSALWVPAVLVGTQENGAPMHNQKGDN